MAQTRPFGCSVLRGAVPAFLLAVTFISCADASHESRQPAAPSAVAGQADSLTEAIASESPRESWKFIVLHHSGTESGSVESIDAAHLQRRDAAGNPWKGIGYHFVIGNGQGMPDGAIEPTFRWEQQIAGAHAGIRMYNEFGIGICLIGNFEHHPPTEAQQAALSELLDRLMAEFQMDADRILRHGDLKATACPGKLFNRDRLVAGSDHEKPSQDGEGSTGFSSVTPGSKEGIQHVARIIRSRSARSNAGSR